MVLLLYSTLLFSITIHPPVTAIKPNGWSGWKMDVVKHEASVLKTNRFINHILFVNRESDE